MVNALIRDAFLNHPLYQGKLFPSLLQGTEDSRRGSDNLRSPDVAEMLGFEALSMLGLPLRPPGPLRSYQTGGGLGAQQTPVALLKKGSHSSDGQGGRRLRSSSPPAADLHTVFECSPSFRERSHPARDSRDSRSGSRSPSPSPGRSHSTSPDNSNVLVINHTPHQTRSPQVPPTSSNPG